MFVFSPTVEQRTAINHVAQPYVVVDGGKRIAAAIEAGLQEMAAIIVTFTGSPLEVTSKVQQVINLYLIDKMYNDCEAVCHL